MSDSNTDEINQIYTQLDEIITRLEVLEGAKDKSFNQRMSYLTWCLANPVSLIFIPAFVSIGFEISINNWGSTFSEWTAASLTNSTNWTIPILVATVGLIVSFGNKLYLIIQERGDMSLLAQLDAKINGLNRKRDRERDKRDADYKLAQDKRDADYKLAQDKRDADYKLAQDKRDADMKAMQEKHDREYALIVDKLSDVKIKQAIAETKLEKTEDNK
jgi:hypothetical protein